MKVKFLKVKNIESLIVGLIGVFAGVFLTIIWDIYKTHVSDKRTEKIVLAAIKSDLESNIGIIKSDQSFLNAELKVIPQGQTIVEPITPLKAGFFDLLNLNSPMQFNNNPTIFLKLREISLSIDFVNEDIKSRENYRISNGAMSNFSSRLQKYDDGILMSEKDLLKALIEIKTDLENEN